MGTMLRILGVSAANQNLPLAQIPYNGVVDGLEVAFHPRVSLLFSKDLSANAVDVVKKGSPTFIDTHMIGDGLSSGLIASVDTSGNTSRTLSLVAKMDSALASGNLFFFGDYRTSGGCTIFHSKAYGLRPQVYAGGALFTSADTEGLNLAEDIWFFASLRVDVDAGVAIFDVPALDFRVDKALPAALDAGTGNLQIGLAPSGGSFGPAPVAFASYHSRVLTDAEVLRQYLAAQSYCSIVGLEI